MTMSTGEKKNSYTLKHAIAQVSPSSSFSFSHHHLSHWLIAEEGYWVRKLKNKGQGFKNKGSSAMKAESQKSVENINVRSGQI